MPAPTHKKPKNWIPPDIPYISVVHSTVDTTGRALIYKLDAATRKPSAKKNQTYQEWRRDKRVPMDFRDLVLNMFSPMPLKLLCEIFVIMWQFDKQRVCIDSIYERAVIDIIAEKLKSTGKREPYHVTPCDFYHWFTRSNHFRFRKEPWMATLANAFSAAPAVSEPKSAPKKRSKRLSPVEVKQTVCKACNIAGHLNVVKRKHEVQGGVVRSMRCGLCNDIRDYVYTS